MDSGKVAVGRTKGNRGERSQIGGRGNQNILCTCLKMSMNKFSKNYEI